MVCINVHRRLNTVFKHFLLSSTYSSFVQDSEVTEACRSSRLTAHIHDSGLDETFPLNVWSSSTVMVWCISLTLESFLLSAFAVSLRGFFAMTLSDHTFQLNVDMMAESGLMFHTAYPLCDVIVNVKSTSAVWRTELHVQDSESCLFFYLRMAKVYFAADTFRTHNKRQKSLFTIKVSYTKWTRSETTTSWGL